MEKRIGLHAIIILFLIGCSTPKRYFPQIVDSDPSQQTQIREQFENYLEWSNDQLADNGWIPDTKCDGLLFNSIFASVGGDANPLLAESLRYPGKFYRSPEHDCFQKSLSRSECSRDQYLGVMLWILTTRNLPAIERIVKWGERNNGLDFVWIMCNGQPGAIEFRPNTIETAKLLRFHLGGSEYHALIPMQFSNKCDGYECHIQAIHVWIRGQIRGWISEKEFEFFKSNANRFNNNALFRLLYSRYAGDVGQKRTAGELLLKLFPSDDLPRSSDHCGFYLWERDPSGLSWQPCPDQDKIHSGIDFLLASAIYLNEI